MGPEPAKQLKENPMKRALPILAVMVSLLLATCALGGGAAFTVHTAAGAVGKADKDSLTIKPRGPDGKFAKSITLKLTGTSKITQLSQQKRSGKLVFVQNDVDAKDLSANQPIAVIYATGGKNSVLLSAVVQPAK
jgi:hypothetical protein